MVTVSGLDIIQKYNWQVPRYTSYPPSPHFTQKPIEARVLEMIQDSNFNGASNASIYFHIPFCPKRCLFCGCHTEIGRTGAFIRNYMETLQKELDLFLPFIDRNRYVTQIHFGGGTPNAVPFKYLNNLLRKIENNLRLDPKAEIAIECDPNLLTLDKVRELGSMGFNRLSIGIQDFDEKVLAAVNRKFPKVSPKEIFSVAKEWGFNGNNLDLIYGLPFQTQESFRLAIQKAIDANPDRISLFPYAHVPWVKDHQSLIHALPMASPEERISIAWESREALLGAGFIAIGMDHFAKPSDELAIAAGSQGLHRNFQGYCTKARAGQIYALGASAISQLEEGYIQNAKDLNRYLSLVESGNLSHDFAYRLTPENQVVRKIINSVLCEGEVDLAQCLKDAQLSVEWKEFYLSEVIKNLSPFLSDDLITVHGHYIRLTENGHYASRAIASVFDPMIKPKTEIDTPKYSSAL